ncbi:restriction endonuclease subunit S [Escherichia coli]
MSWQSEPLSALTLKIGSGSTPRGGDSVYISEGTTLIRSQNVYNNEFSTDGLVYIDEKTAEKMKGVSVEKEDVLVNITGDSVARCCLVHDAVLPARVNQHVAILRTNPKKLLPHFLAFYMVSPFMQAKMLSWAGTGGTRKALTKGMLEGFEIPLPLLMFKIKSSKRLRLITTSSKTTAAVFSCWKNPLACCIRNGLFTCASPDISKLRLLMVCRKGGQRNL